MKTKVKILKNVNYLTKYFKFSIFEIKILNGLF